MLGNILRKNKMAAIGSAANKIVHDMRTPITSITLSADILVKQFPEAKEYIDKIRLMTEVMSDLAQEVMDYAKGVSNELVYCSNDLDSFFSKLIDMMSPMAAKKNIEITFENFYGEPSYFDTKLLRRILMNLLTNAMEAIKYNGKIKITAELVRKDIKITVTDDGPGIPEDILNRIFEPFVTYGKLRGTGLGLAICRHVVELHNGRIIASNHSNGAQFEIYLPEMPS
ncbi:MAG: HAMP domain-containing histidine kinase, partial [Candidatus Cloacimonetes bacterium]|nr:HAMP domain-containing histidine kinase [Candidatus Cloacimonadota bacterium]